MNIEAFFSSISWFDYRGLYALNVELGHPSLDRFWLTITHMENLPWVRFALLPGVLLWLFYKYRWEALKPILALAIVVGAADAISYRLIKKNVDRPRPFQNPVINTWVRQVGTAHGPSFPSNHAANCFAAASILSFYFYRQRKYFYIFAGLVALSRPALGVHYPSDVLVGAYLGLVVAGLFKVIVLNRLRLLHWKVLVSEGEDNSSGWRVRNRRLEDS